MSLEQGTEKEPVFSRSEVVRRIGGLQEIKTPEGIQVNEQVTLGGVKQWISIRGLNKNNPVLLFIHGGPGSPVIPGLWAFEKPWEDFFTVVQWDHRGVGKNWNYTDHNALAPTLKTDQIISDAAELVTYLRNKLHKDKIAVLGWSYGTTVGCELVTRHPEWISVWVPLGQTTPGQEEAIYDRLMTLALEKSDRDTIAKLEALAPYPDMNAAEPVAKILDIRKIVQAYNGAWYGKPNLDLFSALQDFSPEYSAADAATLNESTDWLFTTIQKNERDPIRFLKTAHKPTDYKVPVIMIMGRYDLQTPYLPALRYFETITAPKKKFVTFERSAHFVMLEQPGEFLKVLIDDVLPLTEGEAKFATLPDAPQ